MWKDFFYFTRSERRVVLLLIVLILMVCVAHWAMPMRDDGLNIDEEHFHEEYMAFVGSLRQVEKEKEIGLTRNERLVKKELKLVEFDPNRADSTTFANVGLPGWMIANIEKYRSKGGRFRKAEDFAKVYGLTDLQYQTLVPYIVIEELPRQGVDTMRLLVQAPIDSFPSIVKYEVGTVIDLNAADTVELKKIPGVGSAIARMIVRYREQLGGYYDVSQLSEIQLRADVLSRWLVVDKDSIRKMPINRMGIEALRKHPYLNFYQAKVVVEHRKKRGRVKSFQELALYEEFTEYDFNRLQHYVWFD